MNFKFFFNGINNIVLSPVKFWETVISEHPSTALVRNGFFIPLVLLVSLSAFFGSILFANAELSTSYSVLFSIKCIIVIFITVYSTSYLLGEVTYPLDLVRDFNISFSLVVFSATPFLICQILSRMFESLLFVNIIGLYGLHVFWIGAEKILNPPQYKKMPLLIAVTIIFAGIYIATNLLLSMITDRVYYSFLT